jgi:hypothetical protein
MMNVEWLLPAAKEAYKRREEIQAIWQRILAILLGKKTKIAFTGMSGAGKTVLFDYLRGEGYKRGYTPPGRPSASVESKKIPASERKRFAISVVPGQDAPARHVATEKLFGQKKLAVDGVVHVVSNGFIQTRGEWSRPVLEEIGYNTLDSYREYQLEGELKDLDLTCELIRKSIQKFRKPQWLIVAATKVDLYYDSILEARQYYSPVGESLFVDRIKRLIGQVGSDNFSWTAAPVCAWLEDFEWKDTKVSSVLKPHQRDRFLASLANLLESYCER